MGDITVISPTIVQYRIHLIEEAKPTLDIQRRFNPIVKEPVRNILKCPDN